MRGSSLARLGFTIPWIMILLSVIVIILRRPEAVFLPQFWAEDGAFWYAQAYQIGPFTSLFSPENGYFQTISRLTADLSLALPLTLAPLFFNLCAIAVQVAPVGLLWSKRFQQIVPNTLVKLILTVFYLLLPNAYEVHANITNAHWHLALLVFMLLIAAPPQRLLTKIFDYATTALSALSGPFSIVLAPIAIFYWWRKKTTHTKVMAGILSLGAFIQVISVGLSVSTTRSHQPLGISAATFTKIIGGQIFGAGTIGMNNFNWLMHHKLILIGFFLVGTAIMLAALLYARLELKLFILFCFLLLMAGLASPMISYTQPQWQVLATQGAGTRYYFFPILAWFAVLAWGLSFNRWLRLVSGALLVVGVIGLVADFKLPPYDDFGFNSRVQQFNGLPAGSDYSFPLNPAGIEMHLKKH